MNTHIAPLYPQFIDIDTETGWVCICGNTPESEGFLLCTSDGQAPSCSVRAQEVLFLCVGCGRIIDGNTGQVRYVLDRTASLTA